MSEQSKNKRTFEVIVDGKELKLAVVRPDGKTQDRAMIVYNSAFKESVSAGAILRAKVASVLREQSLWDDVRQKQFEDILQTIRDGELKLKKGGIRAKEAREIALKMRRARAELAELNADRNALDSKTAESCAENAKFNWLVSECTVWADSGKRFFKSLDDYRDRQGDDVAATNAAINFGKLYYGLEDGYEAKLPENQFMIKYGFCNEKLQLVNSEGKLIDEMGRLIDEDGWLVDEQGNRVDSEGNKLTPEGDYDLETLPFLDDEGNPIEVK